MAVHDLFEPLQVIVRHRLKKGDALRIRREFGHDFDAEEEGFEG
jgi:hypothetical protein